MHYGVGMLSMRISVDRMDFVHIEIMIYMRVRSELGDEGKRGQLEIILMEMTPWGQ